MKSCLPSAKALWLGFLFLTAVRSAHGDVYRCEGLFAERSPPPSVEEHLSEKRVQEAAWRAVDLGHFAEAHIIEKQIHSILESAAVVGVPKMIAKGSSETFLVQLEGGLTGVFKPHQKHWKKRILPFHEERAAQKAVAAFKLDRLVGGFLIPVTVLRKINDQSGSLQIYVHEDKRPTSKLNFRNLDRLRIIDFLVAGWDRPKNFLRVQEGIVGIDYDMSFILKPIHISHGISSPPSFTAIQSTAIDQISSFKRPSAEAVFETLKDLLTPEEIEAVQVRLNQLFDYRN